MRRGVGEVEEEGGVAVALDEADRLVGEHVGQVLILTDLRVLESAPDLVRTLRRRRLVVERPELDTLDPRVDEDAATLEHAEVLVEAAAHRVVLALAAEMPLADHAGGVALRLERVGEGALAETQAEVGVAAHRVELPAEAGLIAAGQQARARRAADRVRHVALLEQDAAARERVDVGRLDHLAAVDPDVGRAEVVGEDQDDVGLPISSRWRGGCRRDREEARDQEGGGEQTALRLVLHDPLDAMSAGLPRRWLPERREHVGHHARQRLRAPAHATPQRDQLRNRAGVHHREQHRQPAVEVAVALAGARQERRAAPRRRCRSRPAAPSPVRRAPRPPPPRRRTPCPRPQAARRRRSPPSNRSAARSATRRHHAVDGDHGRRPRAGVDRRAQAETDRSRAAAASSASTVSATTIAPTLEVRGERAGHAQDDQPCGARERSSSARPPLARDGGPCRTTANATRSMSLDQ